MLQKKIGLVIKDTIFNMLLSYRVASVCIDLPKCWYEKRK